MKHNTYATLLLAGIMTTTLVASNGMCADSTSNASTDTNYVQLLDRIQKLETEVQNLRSNLAASFAPTNTIRASRVEIVDTHGKAQLTLCTASNGVCGLFIPSPNDPRLSLGLGAGLSPMLHMRDSKGFQSLVNSRMFITDNGRGIEAKILADEENAFVFLLNKPQDSIAALSNKEGLPALTIGAKPGEVIVSTPEGGAMVTLKAKPGNANAQISANRNGAGVSFTDENGKRRGISTAGDLKE